MKQVTHIKGGPSHTTMLPTWQISAVRLKAESENCCPLCSACSWAMHILCPGQGQTYCLYQYFSLLFGRDSSGNTTAHKVANRWLPVLVLPFPMPSSGSNAKMRIAYSAKRMWQPSVTSADPVQIVDPRVEKLWGLFRLRITTRCRLRIRLGLRCRHVYPLDCFHPIKIPVMLFGYIDKI